MLPPLISLHDLPHLCKASAWNIEVQGSELTPAETHKRYANCWRHIEPEKLVGKEAEIFRQLIKTFGKKAFLDWGKPIPSSLRP